MSRKAHISLRALFLWALLAFTVEAHAKIGLVVGEPFGSFGTMMPVGHASIYLDNICAASPTRLRPCHPGEPGVVLSRYHDLKSQHLDWLAIPAFTFFYGVSTPEQVPVYVTHRLESELRESYRQANLLSILPDRVDEHGNLHPPPYGDWEEGIGAAFDRNLLVYTIRTTPEQDDALLAFLNADPNHRRYTLGRANCADFAEDLLRIVLPGVFHRNVLADFDMTTPKYLARQLDAYGRAHLSLDLQVYEIPQIPGSLRRSRPTRGAAESLMKTKRYLFTLLAVQPELALTDWIIYTTQGKWTPGRDAAPLSPYDWDGLTTQTTQAATQNPVKPPTPSEDANPPINTGEIISQKLAY
jgi:hypothetical protein